MTKTTKLAVDTIIPAEAPATAAKPYMLQVFGSITIAMQQAAVLIRQGYVPCIDTPIQIFGEAGTIFMTLVLGNPDKAFIELAAVTTADAIALEQAKYQRDVEEAAARQIEAAKQADKEAKRAALIAEQRKQLAALEAEIAAT